VGHAGATPLAPTRLPFLAPEWSERGGCTKPGRP
jgi:hypothetical protein